MFFSLVVENCLEKPRFGTSLVVIDLYGAYYLLCVFFYRKAHNKIISTMKIEVH